MSDNTESTGYIEARVTKDTTVELKFYKDGDITKPHYDSIDLDLKVDDIIYFDILEIYEDSYFATFEIRGYDHVGIGTINKNCISCVS